MVTRGKPFLDYVNNLPVEATPDSADRVYLGGATSRRVDADTLTSGGTGVGDSPTFTGVVTHDGSDTVLERTAGGTTSLRVYSDTAGYLVFADENGVSQFYVDVATDSGLFRIRDSAGDIFFEYEEGVGVSFPQGGAVEATSTLNKLHGPITQAAYDLLTPDPNTLYVIVG